MVQVEFSPFVQNASTLCSTSNTELLVWDITTGALVNSIKVRHTLILSQ
jgi:hypothetical protein